MYKASEFVKKCDNLMNFEYIRNELRLLYLLTKARLIQISKHCLKLNTDIKRNVTWCSSSEPKSKYKEYKDIKMSRVQY